MLPMFVSSGRTNYAIEAMELLLHHDYFLSKREAAELIWCRFVYVHGCPGKNISIDLHMELLIKLLKSSITGLEPNKTETCIVRVGKALGTIYPVLITLITLIAFPHCLVDITQLHRKILTNTY
jgi:hypothetical protein